MKNYKNDLTGGNMINSKTLIWKIFLRCGKILFKDDIIIKFPSSNKIHTVIFTNHAELMLGSLEYRKKIKNVAYGIFEHKKQKEVKCKK